MSVPSFAVMSKVYTHLWKDGDILPSRLPGIQKAARQILANKDRYEKIEAALGIPWYLVGCLHKREADCSFKRHLHNGDLLTARTHQVPAGRPPHGNPPFTWEESAIDALTMRGLQKVADWSIERVAYEAEGYNGWGYANKHLISPYDFAGMDDPDKPGLQEVAHGKYIRDHVFDASVIDQQPGVMSLLKVMSSLDPTILEHAGASAPKLPAPQPQPTAKPPVVTQKPAMAPKAPTGILGAFLTLAKAIFRVFSEGTKP